MLGAALFGLLTSETHPHVERDRSDEPFRSFLLDAPGGRPSPDSGSLCGKNASLSPVGASSHDGYLLESPDGLRDPLWGPSRRGPSAVGSQPGSVRGPKFRPKFSGTPPSRDVRRTCDAGRAFTAAIPARFAARSGKPSRERRQATTHSHKFSCNAGSGRPTRRGTPAALRTLAPHKARLGATARSRQLRLAPDNEHAGSPTARQGRSEIDSRADACRNVRAVLVLNVNPTDCEKDHVQANDDATTTRAGTDTPKVPGGSKPRLDDHRLVVVHGDDR